MLKHTKQQAGVGLIEAMVTLLVISVGFLGIASLQVTAMKQNSSSANHSQAVWYSYNMSDRIRANITEFDAYNGIDTQNTYTQNCSTTVCSNAQMRVADASDWSDMVAGLPRGRGNIVAGADGLLVTVMWDDEGTGANGTNCGPDPEVDLTCYQLVVAR